TVLGKAGAQGFVVLLADYSQRRLGTTPKFLGRLHLGGSPIWALGLGNPILSDSRGNRRLQPSTKFGTPPIDVRESILGLAGSGSSCGGRGMAFKLIEAAEQSWRKIRGADKIEPLLNGIPFKDGTPVIESTPAPQPLAA
ncbi:MAG: hypothetical protein VB143_08800, partial [Burkholderia sp.]